MGRIEESSPNSEAARSLIDELSNTLNDITGDDGRSSYSREAFNPTTDAFLIYWEGSEAMACGSLRRVDNHTCELKRMYSRSRGYGKTVLSALESKACSLGYHFIILSTRKVNAGAVRFYLKNGYREISPYGKYRYSDASVCLGKQLST
ncbi:GNAT family N-acetyltransferase [Mangrovimicrobium sediminis]|uniref:GNAT family N-acetyltransferase n=1 Tax=Mangrovimicrobium sediminis TaxID=2562682 RepID=UPI00197E357F|nr:GNAT family N-acetyltransferase [Haliea sp. SAOS-164]